MSHVTSAGRFLTSDDTTDAQPRPPPLSHDHHHHQRSEETERGRGGGENANKLKNRRKKKRQIERARAKERRCGPLMSPLSRSTMKWRCLVFMFYHRSRPPEQTRGSSQTWGWIRLDSNQRWTGSRAVSVSEPKGLHKQTISTTFHSSEIHGGRPLSVFVIHAPPPRAGPLFQGLFLIRPASGVQAVIISGDKEGDSESLMNYLCRPVAVLHVPSPWAR